MYGQYLQSGQSQVDQVPCPKTQLNHHNLVWPACPACLPARNWFENNSFKHDNVNPTKQDLLKTKICMCNLMAHNVKHARLHSFGFDNLWSQIRLDNFHFSSFSL